MSAQAILSPFPKPCSQLEADHTEYIDVLKAVRELDGIKKVFIRSGIRYDYMLADKDKSFMKELCMHHVSGVLKVAPEHISPRVLKNMRKPAKEVFDRFSAEYSRMNKKLGKKQYMIPYFISSHPGSTLQDAVELALYMKETGFVPDQVQDFYPTPGTLATCMYYTEMDPFTMKKVYVAKTEEEKKMQRALMHFNKRENRKTVIKALQKAGREDLVEVLRDEYNARGPPRVRRRQEAVRGVGQNDFGRRAAAGFYSMRGIRCRCKGLQCCWHRAVTAVVKKARSLYRSVDIDGKIASGDNLE